MIEAFPPSSYKWRKHFFDFRCLLLLDQSIDREKKSSKKIFVCLTTKKKCVRKLTTKRNCFISDDEKRGASNVVPGKSFHSERLVLVLVNETNKSTMNIENLPLRTLQNESVSVDEQIVVKCSRSVSSVFQLEEFPTFAKALFETMKRQRSASNRFASC